MYYSNRYTGDQNIRKKIRSGGLYWKDDVHDQLGINRYQNTGPTVSPAKQF